MMVGPIVFAAILTGIGAVGDLKLIGRVGWKAFNYFEASTTLALVLGLIVVARWENALDQAEAHAVRPDPARHKLET